MEIILLEKVTNLGALGAKVNVKSGYGRNFLIPYGKAVPATKANLEAFEARRAELERQEAEVLANAQARATQLSSVAVVIAAKSGDEGKLFGSVGTRGSAGCTQWRRGPVACCPQTPACRRRHCGSCGRRCSG